MNSSDGDILLEVRAQKMPYLTNVEENELKRLKTTTDEGILGDAEFFAAKARGAPLLGIGEERTWWDSDSIFFKCYSFP